MASISEVIVMKLWFATVLTLVLALPPAPSGGQGDDASTDADILALLELKGDYEIARQHIEELIVPLHATHPQIPEDFWDEAVASLRKNDFYAELVPSYRKRMPADDVKALLRFGRTPVGRRALRALSRLGAEAENARRKWSAAFLERVKCRALERGYRL